MGFKSKRTDESSDLISRSEVESLIGQRLHQYRHAAWEDDFSKNALDNQPFNNRPPISDRLEELDGLGVIGLKAEEVQQLAAKDTAPIPCDDDRERYSVGQDGKFWISGFRDYRKVMEVADSEGVAIEQCLDFGCASGRLLRHFAAQSEIPAIWGSDVNARHIRWLSEFMPNTVKPIANHALPMLPLPDASQNLITAFSVFTHIDTFETCWLAELRRVLAPGGIAYISIHNEDTWKVLKDELDNPNNRLIQSMVTTDPESAKLLQSGNMPAGRTVYQFTHMGPYRAQVFHTNDYINNVWGRFFKVVDILPLHHVRQSVVVLK